MSKLETRSIKFYLDDSINKVKKEKILKFLNECLEVENKIIEHYWNHEFEKVVTSKDKIAFNYGAYKPEYPKLKSHHYQQVLQQAFHELKSISNRIKNSIRFKFDDIQKQAIYNYFAKACFNWSWLEKYIKQQIMEFKKDDKDYLEFLKLTKSIIEDKEKFGAIKKEIENKFWEIKNNFKMPKKKQLQIYFNKVHTIKNIHMKQYQWIFEIDSNDRIGGTEKKPVFGRIIIPVKYSKYHKEILKDNHLGNTFALKMNKYGRIEIIANYKIEIEYPESQPSEVVGIDIGLKKLIVTSDGEIIEQNKTIVKRLKKLVKQQSNRDKLQAHLRKKYNDDSFELPSKNYIKKQNRLSQFIKCHNRYLIKNFLKSRLTDHLIIEDLDIAYSRTHNKETNYLLKRMGIQSIKNYLVEYGKKLGVKVSEVNSAYTSQQCPVCNHTSKNNRKTQETFCCVKCGHTDNADHNASINIRNRYFDKRIKLNTPLWRVREMLGVET